MTQRVEGGVTYQQTFDAENRLVVVTDTVSGEVTRFFYDGDGHRVKKTTPGGVTVYVGEYFERESGYELLDLGNPGFEHQGGWIEQKVGYFPATSFFRSTWGTAAPRSGSYAYVISNHAYGYLQSDAIAVSANTQYDLYAYVRGEVDAEDSGGYWVVRAVYYDGSGGQISYSNVASGGGGTLDGTWQQKGGRFTTPANAASVRILLFDYMNSGWVAYDDVSLRAATQTTVDTKYYYFGGQRLAERRGGVLYYLHTDHLGSTSLATTATGAAVPGSRTGYFPYGGVRYGGTLPTEFTYTGQRTEVGVGLMDYRARWYSPALGRFVSGDTVVPDPSAPGDLNRYSYARNNPLRYSDPSGHAACLDVECSLVENPVTGEIIQRGTSRIWVYPYNLSGLGEAYQYQGEGTNDCGPTNLAMVINLLSRREGISGNPVDGQFLGDAMQDASRGFGFRGYRLTGLTFRHKGATPPWGMVGAFNEFNTELLAAGGPDLGRAEYRNHGTKADLISNVGHGYYTTIMLVWEGGGAHYITIVGYEADADVFYYLDPDPRFRKLPLEGNVPRQLR